MAEKDANYEQAVLAVTDDANLTPTALLTDPATGRLMVGIKVVTSFSAYQDPPIPRDANRGLVAIAVTDDANLTPKPLLADDSGHLICDINVE